MEATRNWGNCSTTWCHWPPSWSPSFSWKHYACWNVLGFSEESGWQWLPGISGHPVAWLEVQTAGNQATEDSLGSWEYDAISITCSVLDRFATSFMSWLEASIFMRPRTYDLYRNLCQHESASALRFIYRWSPSPIHREGSRPRNKQEQESRRGWWHSVLLPLSNCCKADASWGKGTTWNSWEPPCHWPLVW